MNIKALIAELKKLDEENPDLPVLVDINGSCQDFTIVADRDSDCFPSTIRLVPG